MGSGDTPPPDHPLAVYSFTPLPTEYTFPRPWRPKRKYVVSRKRQKVKRIDRTCLGIARLLDELQVDFITEVLVIHAFVNESLSDDM